MGTLKALQRRLASGHKKVRGSRVSSELKANLIAAIKQGDYTLSQMASIFNLSISYISRVKAELQKANPIQNAYEDHQLIHQTAA